MALANRANQRHLCPMRNNRRTAKAKAIALRANEKAVYLWSVLAGSAALLLALLLLSRP